MVMWPLRSFSSPITRASVLIGFGDASEAARMEVDCWTSGMELRVEDAAQRCRQRGMTLFVHAAVPDQNGVGRQLCRAGAEVVGERQSGDLLLALDDEAQVDRRSAGGEEVLRGFDGRQGIALVVRGAAPPDFALPDRRLEGRRLPPVYGIYRQ